jgi:RNA polymerase sigma factor (sigma-70 family)
MEDLIQDVVLKALSNASSYSPEKGAYSTWVGAIALNTVKSALYNRGRRREFLRGYRDECSELSLQRSNETASDRYIRAEQAESELYSMAYTERDRTILKMRAEGYGTGEIAKELSIKPSVVSLAVHHVKKRLGDAA